MKKKCLLTKMPEEYVFPVDAAELGAYKSGIYQGFDRKELIAIAKEEDLIVKFLYPVGTFVIEGNALAILNKQPASESVEQKINVVVNIKRGQEIDISYDYGFRQLMEIAVRALSPGINDPGTAVLALQALADLAVYKLDHFVETTFKDNDGTVRLITREKTFTETFKEYFYPIWDYGKNDRVVQIEMLHALTQLRLKGTAPEVEYLYNAVKAAVSHQEI